MAVHFTFAASKAHRLVPCVGDSISLAELKDAIALPLVAALKGKQLREKFDFRVYDADTKEEIVGVDAKVRKNASVLVKRVPAFLVSRAQQKAQPVVQQTEVRRSGTSEAAINNKRAESVVDDEFGEDVYSTSIVSTVSSERSTSKEVEKVESVVAEVEKESRERSEEVEEEEQPCNESRVVQSVQVPCNESRVVQSTVQVSCDEIPVELMCTLCKNFMNDPVLIPCCCNSFCRGCIRVALVGGNRCPKCASCKCREADLLPNRHLKSMIDAHFKSNPSASNVVSSSGSCSSETSRSRSCVVDGIQAIPPKNVVVDWQQTTISNRQKRKPLIVLLNDSAKKKLKETDVGKIEKH